jgi:hypothetical protein
MARVFNHHYNPTWQFVGGFIDEWDQRVVTGLLHRPRDEYMTGRVVAAALRQYCKHKGIIVHVY